MSNNFHFLDDGGASAVVMIDVTCSGLSERSDLMFVRRLAAVPRPEKPHLEALLRGQRSKLLNLSDNIET